VIGFHLFLKDIDIFDMSDFRFPFATIDSFYPSFSMHVDIPTMLKYLCSLFCAKSILMASKVCRWYITKN